MTKSNNSTKNKNKNKYRDNKNKEKHKKQTFVVLEIDGLSLVIYYGLSLA